MRILTAEEMREVDRRAIEEIGVPSLVLMENAAIGVADALAERYPRAETVAIFCTPIDIGMMSEVAKKAKPDRPIA